MRAAPSVDLSALLYAVRIVDRLCFLHYSNFHLYSTENPGMDWEYFSFSGHTRPELLPYTDGIVEVVMKVRLRTSPSLHIFLILLPDEVA